MQIFHQQIVKFDFFCVWRIVFIEKCVLYSTFQNWVFVLLVCSMITPTVFKTLESTYEEFYRNEHPITTSRFLLKGNHLQQCEEVWLHLVTIGNFVCIFLLPAGSPQCINFTSVNGFMCDTFQRWSVTCCYIFVFCLFCNFNRTYLSTDVIRRVMTQMFGIDVVLVMGVTDIDDKIIRRATQVHAKPPAG